MKCLQMLPVTMLLIFPALTSAELIYSDENIDTPLTVPTGGAASTSLYAPGASGIDNIQGIDGPGDATAYQVGLHSTYTNSHLFYFDGTTNVLVTQNSTLGLRRRLFRCRSQSRRVKRQLHLRCFPESSRGCFINFTRDLRLVAAVR